MSRFIDPVGEAAWMARLEHGTRHEQAEAAVHLAAIAAAAGQDDRAERLLRTVCQSGDHEWAPRAAFDLGQMLADRGDRAAGERLIELAASLSVAAITPDVHNDVAARWAVHGRAADAERAYAEVVEAARRSLDPALQAEAAVAAFRLGDLRAERGDLPGAEEAYVAAVQSDDEEAAPHAALALARLLRNDHDRSGLVDRLLAVTIDADHPDLSPEAALVLGLRREDQGARAQAWELYQAVRESEHPEFAVEAAERLARLLDSGTERYVSDTLEEAVLFYTSHPDEDHIASLDLIPALNVERCVVTIDDCQVYLAAHEAMVSALRAMKDRTITVNFALARHSSIVSTKLVMSALTNQALASQRADLDDLVIDAVPAGCAGTVVSHDRPCDIATRAPGGGDKVATNPPTGDGHRNGAVRNRSQVRSPNGNWVKRDTQTGRFMDQKQDGKPFKGVRREK
jgi:tetratricopeptide (TPR) repeat protein